MRPGTLSEHVYGASQIVERHRHRYEVNNAYRDVLRAGGLVVSATSLDGKLVEMIELPDHPWFVAGQFHPELKSRPTRAHPLFAAFVGAGAARAAGREEAVQQAELAERAAEELAETAGRAEAAGRTETAERPEAARHPGAGESFPAPPAVAVGG